MTNLKRSLGHRLPKTLLGVSIIALSAAALFCMPGGMLSTEHSAHNMSKHCAFFTDHSDIHALILPNALQIWQKDDSVPVQDITALLLPLFLLLLASLRLPPPAASSRIGPMRALAQQAQAVNSTLSRSRIARELSNGNIRTLVYS